MDKSSPDKASASCTGFECHWVELVIQRVSATLCSRPWITLASRRFDSYWNSSTPTVQQAWDGLVIPLLQAWAKGTNREIAIDRHDDGGRLVEQVEGTTLLTWVATDLSEEFSPSFKLLVDDPDMDEPGESQAQIFLATVTRNVRLSDGTRRTIRIPDTILRVRSSEDESLLDALGRIATQWDLF